MSFSVRWDPLAAKQLQKLPRDAVVRILARVRQASASPRLIEPLTEHEYGYKIRAGE